MLATLFFMLLLTCLVIRSRVPGRLLDYDVVLNVVFVVYIDDVDLDTFRL